MHAARYQMRPVCPGRHPRRGDGPSVISGRHWRPAKKHRGVNWMNSARSLTATPATIPGRCRRRWSPPVGGRAGCRCPSPPVARITDGALDNAASIGLTTNSPVTARYRRAALATPRGRCGYQHPGGILERPLNLGAGRVAAACTMRRRGARLRVSITARDRSSNRAPAPTKSVTAQ